MYGMFIFVLYCFFLLVYDVGMRRFFMRYVKVMYCGWIVKFCDFVWVGWIYVFSFFNIRLLGWVWCGEGSLG